MGDYMINRFEAAEYSAGVLVFVLFIVAMYLLKIRNKRGYRLIGIGSLLLELSIIIDLIFNNHSPSLIHKYLIIIDRAFYLTGCYFVLVGLLFMHKLISRNGRLLIYGISLIWIIISLFPIWLSHLLAGLLFGLVFILISKKFLFRFLSINLIIQLMAIVEVSEALIKLKKWVDFFPNWSAWTHPIFISVFVLIVLLDIINVLTNVLNQSWRSSITDALTGLFNRRYFNSRLQKYVEREKDVALKVVADILREEVENSGLVGRWGGEEMVIMVTKVGIETGAFAEKVRQRIEKESKVTASLGFSNWSKGISSEELVKRADEAMYNSKTTGKNKVTGFR
jgi:two-component system cell cycle response regulator